MSVPLSVHRDPSAFADEGRPVAAQSQALDNKTRHLPRLFAAESAAPTVEAEVHACNFARFAADKDRSVVPEPAGVHRRNQKFHLPAKPAARFRLVVGIDDQRDGFEPGDCAGRRFQLSPESFDIGPDPLLDRRPCQQGAGMPVEPRRHREAVGARRRPGSVDSFVDCIHAPAPAAFPPRLRDRACERPGRADPQRGGPGVKARSATARSTLAPAHPHVPRIAAFPARPVHPTDRSGAGSAG